MTPAQQRALDELLQDMPADARAALLSTVAAIVDDRPRMTELDALATLGRVGVSAVRGVVPGLPDLIEGAEAAAVLIRWIAGKPSPEKARRLRRHGIASGMAGWMASRLAGPAKR